MQLQVEWNWLNQAEADAITINTIDGYQGRLLHRSFVNPLFISQPSTYHYISIL